MPYSTSVTRGSHTIEAGGVRMGDEAELARMGYKQELKYVQVNFYVPLSVDTHDACALPDAI